MAEKITLIAQRFNKEKFNETVNKEFTQLVNVPDPSFFDRDLADLDDFWYLYDNKRDPNNVIENKLEANSNAADYTSVDWLDFTSNGFKWRYGSDKNASSSPYIYLAFAESPFVNSNAIPTNAI